MSNDAIEISKEILDQLRDPSRFEFLLEQCLSDGRPVAVKSTLIRAAKEGRAGVSTIKRISLALKEMESGQLGPTMVAEKSDEFVRLNQQIQALQNVAKHLESARESGLAGVYSIETDESSMEKAIIRAVEGASNRIDICGRTHFQMLGEHESARWLKKSLHAALKKKSINVRVILANGFHEGKCPAFAYTDLTAGQTEQARDTLMALIREFGTEENSGRFALKTLTDLAVPYELLLTDDKAFVEFCPPLSMHGHMHTFLYVNVGAHSPYELAADDFSKLWDAADSFEALSNDIRSWSKTNPQDANEAANWIRTQQAPVKAAVTIASERPRES